ncbi:MAG: hypothetical protein GWP07_00725 [Xanthomonadaceae bacterium]|nr:hypothetical protein [Xanthomonadaceae bacterium]
MLAHQMHVCHNKAMKVELHRRSRWLREGPWKGPEYFETGKMHYAIHFNNGENEHEYDCYPNGSVWYEKIRSGGEFVSTARYNEDGTLARFCDANGCVDY